MARPMLVLTNARIVDGTADRPTDPVSVVVEGGTIREVGPRAGAAGAETVSYTHLTLPTKRIV